MNPIFLPMSADPWTDPLISHLPHTAELVKKDGVELGQRIRTLESHTFISTTTDHKGPACYQLHDDHHSEPIQNRGVAHAINNRV